MCLNWIFHVNKVAAINVWVWGVLPVDSPSKGPVLRMRKFVMSWRHHKLCFYPPGLHTGSVYNDSDLRKTGFIGESVQDGSVFVIKTHLTDHRERYDRAILVYRSPYDSIKAEWNRVHAGHTGLAIPKPGDGK